MSKEKVSYDLMTCDRCAAILKISNALEAAPTASISIQHGDGGAVLPHGYKADMCEKCTDEFSQWWRLPGVKS
jgi:hypothetical protein